MAFRDHRPWLRCNHCRTRRSTFPLLWAHMSENPGCMPCTCGGYHYPHRKGSPCGGYHYPHRKGSPCCEANDLGFANSALRAGATAEEYEELKRRLAAMECPF